MTTADILSSYDTLPMSEKWSKIIIRTITRMSKYKMILKAYFRERKRNV